MSTLLYLEASPRRKRSHSTKVAEAFLATYAAQNPSDTVDRLDLWSLDLPRLDGDDLGAKYAIMYGESPTPDQQRAWSSVEAVFDRFGAADKYLISLPMWNFGVPYVLKHYVDIITQPGLSWRVSPEGGYEGLVDGSAVVVYSSASEYHAGSGSEALDMQKPYVETWLGFIGISDVQRIVVAGSLGDPSVFREAEQAALARASELAARF